MAKTPNAPGLRAAIRARPDSGSSRTPTRPPIDRGAEPRQSSTGSVALEPAELVETVRVLSIKQKLIAYQAPLRNGYCERVIESIRRACLDRMILFAERRLRRVLREHLAYYQEARTHLGLDEDAPEPRAIRPQTTGPAASGAMLGGLHHCYTRAA